MPIISRPYVLIEDDDGAMNSRKTFLSDPYRVMFTVCAAGQKEINRPF
jgi:hypothetical protein